MPTEDKDLGYKRILAATDEINGAYVKTGFQGEKGDQDKRKDDGSVEPGLTVTQVAVYHEFGSADGKRPPERSFLRSTFDRKRMEWRQATDDLLWKICTGKETVSRALGLIGTLLVKDTKQTIQQSIDLQPLAEITIKKKGSDKPLIDTGQLINSITFEKVLKKGG